MIKKLLLITSSIFIFTGCDSQKSLQSFQKIDSIDSLNQFVKTLNEDEKKDYNDLQHSAWFHKFSKLEKRAKKVDFRKLSQTRKEGLLTYASYNSIDPIKRLEFLINKGATLKNYDEIFLKASYGYAGSKTKEVLQYLVKLGANPFVTSSYYGSALQYAVNGKKNIEAIKYLLSLGLKPYKSFNKKPSPYSVAIKSNSLDLKYLFSSSYLSKIKKVGTDGLTLDQYIKKNELSILTQYFINQKLNIPKPKLPKKPTEPKMPSQDIKLKKGEFETTAMFEKRVQKEKQKIARKVDRLNKRYQQDVKRYNDKVKKISEEYNKKVEYLQSNIDKIQSVALNRAYGYIYGKPVLKDIKYDADKQKFFAKVVSSKNDLSYNVELNVPLKDAKNTKKRLQDSTVKMIFDYKLGKMTLKDIDIITNNKTLTAFVSNKDYNQKQEYITLNTKDLKFDKPTFLSPTLASAKTSKGIVVKGHGVSEDLLKGNDELMSLLSKVNPAKIDSNKYAFVVGVEDYLSETDVTYSSNSAKMFSKYLTKALGVPKDNIFLQADQKDTVSGSLKIKFRQFIKSLDKDSIVYFYYSGHGVPSNKDGSAYLLPADADLHIALSDPSMKVENIYNTLKKAKPKHIYSFVDSCFSGKDEKGKLLFDGVAPVRKVKKINIDKSNMTIFTAGSSTDFSNQYEEKNHRLFSYFLMKGLADGKVDANELHKYIRKNVMRVSRQIGSGHFQEPQIDGNSKRALN
jgi:hypothetical protein